MLISNKFGLIYCLVLEFASTGKVGFLFDFEPPVGEPAPPVALWVITSPINNESWVDTHGTVEVEGTKIKNKHGLIEFRIGGGGTFSLYENDPIADNNDEDWSNGFDKKPVDTKWPTPGTQPGNTHPWRLDLYGDSQTPDPLKLQDQKSVSFLAT